MTEERRFEMRDVLRWVLVLGIALVLIGLMAKARGPKHHHGDDVGALKGVPAWLS